MEIQVMKRVLDRNQDKAEDTRNFLAQKQVKMYNLISSPGAGKTALLEKTCETFKDILRMGIIEGDVSTDRDAQRLKKYDIPITLINTEGGCHLDSSSTAKALESFDLDNINAIFVENVGNLVCPTHFDLGEYAKIAVVSPVEGDDKPVKYPMLFRDAKVVILNKMDLMEHTNFNYDTFLEDLRNVNPNVPLIELSCTNNTGMEKWYDWLRNDLNSD